MRFTIQKKMTFLGAGITFLLMLAAFLISLFVYQNRSYKNLIKSVDNSIVELLNSMGSDSDIASLKVIKDRTLEVYESFADEQLPEFANKVDEYNFYLEKYSFIYPNKPGILGLSNDKLIMSNNYSVFSNCLANSVISSGGVSAYVGFYDLDRDRIVIICDSRFRLDSRGEGSGYLFGSYIQIEEMTQSEVDENFESNGYVINGAMVRGVDLYYKGEGEQEYVATAFIEYNEVELQNSVVSFVTIEAISLIGVFALMIALYIILARFTIVKNLLKLTDSAEKFTSSLSEGEHLEVVDPKIKTKDEIGSLANSFIALENGIIEYTKKIEQNALEREKINAELGVAAKIQLEALPISHINDSNVLINASIVSAKEVGGDFYDYFYLDKDHLALIISDVSGKGIPASLFMMRSKELIKSQLMVDDDIALACYKVNNSLLEHNEEGLFVTAFIGILDVNTNILSFVNAGHEKPYIIRDAEVIKLETKSNFILGGVSDFKYQVETVKLKEKDKIFLHTDGLNEAINENNQEFGYENIINNLKNSANLLNGEILNEMTNSLNKFVSTNQPFDDVTMMIVEIKQKQLSLSYQKPDFKAIQEITNRFNDYYSFLDKKTLSEIDIVLDELINNVVSYEQAELLVVDFAMQKDTLVVEIKSNGEEFNPLLNKEKYLEDDSLADTIGGFGISIVKNITDLIEYERKAGFNVLKIYKKINKA